VSNAHENHEARFRTSVASGASLGLPYVTVAAHPRHIQGSIFLFHAKHLAEWDRAKLAA
jgi:hypothetical protein